MFFADNSFLFDQATLDEVAMFEGLINRYCVELGQKANLNKSCLFFSNNAVPSLQPSISKLLGIRNNTKPEKYLGVGIEFSRAKSANFAELKEDIFTSASSWKGKLLN